MYVFYRMIVHLMNPNISQPYRDPYAFIDFLDHQTASLALLAMDKRLVMGKEIKVNFAAISTFANMRLNRDSKSIHNQEYNIYCLSNSLYRISLHICR